MAAVRLIRLSRPSPVLGSPTLQTAPSTVRVRLRFMSIVSGFSSKSGRVNVKPVAVTAALNDAAIGAPTQTSESAGLVTLLVLIRSVVVRRFKVVTRPRPWRLIVQSRVEKHHSDHGHIMHLLIEALDMFLVGTAMLMFAMGLHVMFVGPRVMNGNGLPVPQSNFFGLFHLKEIPSWAGMKSISQAKSKIGHALMLLLQVGVLEKFKSIPLVSGLDLACFAAAIFVTSAGLFILSRLSDDINT